MTLFRYAIATALLGFSLGKTTTDGLPPDASTKVDSTEATTVVTCPPPYEVDSHQRLSFEAAKRSVNLRHFLEDLALGGVRYSRNFPDMAQQKFSQIRIVDTQAQGLITAGAVLQDQPLTIVLKHFDDPVNAVGLDVPVLPTQIRARNWAFDGGGANNPFDWKSTLDHFEDAVFATSRTMRTDGQEKLFVGLGQVIHLLQDGFQPGHTRNDAHAGLGLSGFQTISPLEVWAIGNFNSGRTHAALRAPVKAAGTVYFDRFSEYFVQAGNMSNGKFFSEDTIFSSFAEPSAGTTGVRFETIPGQPRPLKFITSTSINDPVTGQRTRLANELRGQRFLAALGGVKQTFSSPGDIVVEDQAQVLIPAAIEHSAGLLDHFFRGRFRMTIDMMNQLEITNNADTAPLNSAADATFINGQFRLAYEALDGTLNPLPAAFSPFPLNGMLAVGQSVTIPGDIVAYLDGRRDITLPPNLRAREDRRVVALYRGTIGQEEGVAASRITFANNISLLLSFDTSGSVSSSQLNSAKSAALTLFPILANGMNNRVAVHRFSSSASIVQPFTTNLGAAQTAIMGLSPGGSTALHDAVVLAGVDASAEAMAQPMNKLIVILFTDGADNSSSASAAQAVDAIKTSLHPEIDEVFLVFIGGSVSGQANLQSIALQSVRRFIFLSNFGELTTIFLNAIQI